MVGKSQTMAELEGSTTADLRVPIPIGQESERWDRADCVASGLTAEPNRRKLQGRLGTRAEKHRCRGYERCLALSACWSPCSWPPSLLASYRSRRLTFQLLLRLALISITILWSRHQNTRIIITTAVKVTAALTIAARCMLFLRESFLSLSRSTRQFSAASGLLRA